MNKELIVYMRLIILYMIKRKELDMTVKEMVVFFVLQVIEIVDKMHFRFKTLIFNILNTYRIDFELFVTGSKFSVLIPVPVYFNSLYQDPDSLKN